MNELVLNQNGKPVTTSKLIAEKFGKRHSNVIRDIEETINQMPDSQSQLNFELSEYKDSSGKSNPLYIMDRDGFALLVMGFTGEKAMKFKIEYIAAFNKMAEQLKPKELTTKEILLLALKAEEEKEKALLQVENLETALDNLLDWVSIIKVATHNNVNENNFNWRVLKKQSEKMGYAIKRAESGRFAYQNLYNVNVFKVCYPSYRYDFKPTQKNLEKNNRKLLT